MKAEPKQLRGYAVQVKRNGDSFDTAKDYVNAWCGRTEGMYGALQLAEWEVKSLRDSAANLYHSAKVELFEVHLGLKAAAQGYADEDVESAEAIFTAYTKEKAPQKWSETDTSAHPGNYHDPYAIDLRQPQNVNEFKPRVEKAKKELGQLEKWANKVGVSIAEDVIKSLSGNWDVLLENADGWSQVASDRGIEVINRNLTYGLDSLSPSWDGEAARSFDYLMRHRWVRCLNTMRDLAEFSKLHMELLAHGAKSIFDILIVLIVEGVKWTIKKVLSIIKLIKAGSMLQAKKAIGVLTSFLLDLIGAVKHIIKLVVQLVKTTAKRLEELGTQISLLKQIYFDDRLSPATGG